MGRRKKLINNSVIPGHELEKNSLLPSPGTSSLLWERGRTEAFAAWKKENDAEQSRKETPA